MGKSLSGVALLAAAVLAAGWFVWEGRVAGADGDDDPPDEPQVTNPLGANAACYVCHIPFVKDEMSKVHLKAKVTCIECHGVSAPHANDENIGATKPDVTFKRSQVDKMCNECHDEHDVPADEVIGRFLQRGLPEEPAAVCTDCHGTHRIVRPAEEDE